MKKKLLAFAMAMALLLTSIVPSMTTEASGTESVYVYHPSLALVPQGTDLGTAPTVTVYRNSEVQTANGNTIVNSSNVDITNNAIWSSGVKFVVSGGSVTLPSEHTASLMYTYQDNINEVGGNINWKSLSSDNSLTIDQSTQMNGRVYTFALVDTEDDTLYSTPTSVALWQEDKTDNRISVDLDRRNLTIEASAYSEIHQIEYSLDNGANWTGETSYRLAKYGDTSYNNRSVTFSDAMPIGVGTYSVMVRILTEAGYTTSTQSVTTSAISLSNELSLQRASIVANESVVLYTGKETSVGATVTYNGTTLTNGVDYTLSYSNNIEEGEATVIATGMGNYTGSISTTYQIQTMDMTYCCLAMVSDAKRYDSSGKVIFDGNFAYDGTEKTPTLFVYSLTENRFLIENVDFTTTYYNNKKEGTATVIATGMGVYKGVAMATFDITPNKPTVTSYEKGTKKVSLSYSIVSYGCSYGSFLSCIKDNTFICYNTCSL